MQQKDDISRSQRRKCDSCDRCWMNFADRLNTPFPLPSYHLIIHLGRCPRFSIFDAVTNSSTRRPKRQPRCMPPMATPTSTMLTSLRIATNVHKSSARLSSPRSRRSLSAAISDREPLPSRTSLEQKRAEQQILQKLSYPRPPHAPAPFRLCSFPEPDSVTTRCPTLTTTFSSSFC